VEDGRNAVVQLLARAGCVAADEEAEELEFAAGGDLDLLAHLTARRAEGEPLAWITGSVGFCGRRVRVAPGVYVPRGQTEPLARRAAALLRSGGAAVDLCTGAGPIAVTLADAVPSARVIATELDHAAVDCARSNGVNVFEGFLDDPLPAELRHRVDVMTAVVPYVPTDALHLLPRDVQRYEPRRALDGGAGGTTFLVQVVERSPAWLVPGGWLLLELGGDQAEAIGNLMTAHGFRQLDVMTDDDGDVRAICGQLSTRRVAL
jgi:release factor glutamine methyltransferase